VAKEDTVHLLLEEINLTQQLESMKDEDKGKSEQVVEKGESELDSQPTDVGTPKPNKERM